MSMEGVHLHISIPEAIAPSEDQSYGSYRIVIKVNGLTWSVTHRYSRFREMHKAVKKRFARYIQLPEFPKKKTSTSSSALLEQRRLELQFYLQDLVQHPEIVNCRELDDFLHHRQYVVMSQSPVQMRKSSKIDTREAVPQLDPMEQAEAYYDGSRYESSSERDVYGRDGRTGHYDDSAAFARDSSYPPSSGSGVSGGSRGYGAPDAFDFLEEGDGSLGRPRGSRESSVEGIGGSKRVILSREARPFIPGEYDHGIHSAAAAGNTDQVARLIAENESDVHLLDGHLQSPLHAAAIHGNPRVIRMLLDRGANPNVHDQDGWTPLMCACKHGKAEAIRAVLDSHVKVNACNKDGLAALHFLAGGGDVIGAAAQTELIEEVLRRGADPSISTNARVTPLHECAAVGNVRAVEVLLSQPGVMQDALDASKDTPLHYAMRHQQHRVAKALIFRGANYELAGAEGTPLQMLLKSREERGVQWESPYN